METNLNLNTGIVPNSTNIKAAEEKKETNISSEPDNTDKEDFMQLLITQLQHQDPLKPLENQDFLAQLAQFNALEELKKINNQMAALVELQKVQEPEESKGTE